MLYKVHDFLFFSHPLDLSHVLLTQFCRITTLVSTIRLQVRRRRFEIALKDIIRDANSQRDAANWELLTRSITSGARSDISDILRILVLGCAIRIDVCGHEDIFGCKGVEAPMDAQKYTAEGCIEHGFPNAVEMTWDKSTDVA